MTTEIKLEVLLVAKVLSCSQKKWITETNRKEVWRIWPGEFNICMQAHLTGVSCWLHALCTAVFLTTMQGFIQASQTAQAVDLCECYSVCMYICIYVYMYMDGSWILARQLNFILRKIQTRVDNRCSSIRPAYALQYKPN
jgi:hypothetical protein